ncbi:EF-P beta-lysylation protein EpmB [Pseudidiomarina mangrovi]|uniref:EF-P beta-lysylation protein EpmB n=1 Tax=Pseudidiomarina mangrovi TaxID=2487133 RepID=UPI000FCB7B67|nr:EF-P beta-lysylation protein EpmB [Pseudidiomarina mangrovi]
MATDALPITLRPNWQRELAAVCTDAKQLAEQLNLPAEFMTEHLGASKLFPLRVTQHFISLMTPGDVNDPLLRQVLPHADEFLHAEGFVTDPLAEQHHSQPGVLHKYRSRVLVILRGGCAINCRYCFRRHFPYDQHHFGPQQRAELLDLIRADAAINEVILSGGDPLLATDPQLDRLLSELELLPQLTRVRIHSRLPVVLPSRLTTDLAKRLQASRLNAVLVIHSNHPNEIDPLLTAALQQWRDYGVTLLNQSVLLKGINDDPDILASLSEKLFTAGVLPYYLHQLDKVAGASHFAVSDDQARQIEHQLRGILPGFLVPQLVREIAGEASKTPL